MSIVRPATIVVSTTLLMALAACAGSRTQSPVPADTQPRPYIQDVTNPQVQPQYERNGALHY